MIAEHPRRRLLVVDDEPLIRQTLSLCLHDEYDVKAVASGEEAIEVSIKEDFPVVILDLCMEGISGIETLKRLKKIRTLQNIIILTAYESMESAISALNLGAFNYLTKPFERAHLKKIVSRGFEAYDQQNLRKKDIQQRLMSMHDTFFSLLCHEFNTPLNTILGFSELLVQDSIDPERTSWIREIQKSGTRLHEILTEIMDFIAASHLATSGLEQEFVLQTLLLPVIQTFRENGMQIEIDAHPTLQQKLFGKSDSTGMIARKLISMLSHHSKKVLISPRLVSPDSEGFSRLHLRVTGTEVSHSAIGRGAIKRLFEPYQFIENDEQGQRTSLGLELATCRKLAEFAHGSVDFICTLNDELILVADLPVQVLD